MVTGTAVQALVGRHAAIPLGASQPLGMRVDFHLLVDRGLDGKGVPRSLRWPPLVRDFGGFRRGGPLGGAVARALALALPLLYTLIDLQGEKDKSVQRRRFLLNDGVLDSVTQSAPVGALQSQLVPTTLRR